MPASSAFSPRSPRSSAFCRRIQQAVLLVPVLLRVLRVRQGREIRMVSPELRGLTLGIATWGGPPFEDVGDWLTHRLEGQCDRISRPWIRPAWSLKIFSNFGSGSLARPDRHRERASSHRPDLLRRSTMIASSAQPPGRTPARDRALPGRAPRRRIDTVQQRRSSPP